MQARDGVEQTPKAQERAAKVGGKVSAQRVDEATWRTAPKVKGEGPTMMDDSGCAEGPQGPKEGPGGL